MRCFREPRYSWDAIFERYDDFHALRLFSEIAIVLEACDYFRALRCFIERCELKRASLMIRSLTLLYC